jgi:hypothetical protein
MQHPYKSVGKLENFENIGTGDIIISVSKYFAVQHYIFALGNNQYIHNRVNHNTSITDDGVFVDDIEFIKNMYIPRSRFFLISKYRGNLQTFEQMKKRALSLVGKFEFSYLFNNCEHFINFVVLGQKRSYQIENWTFGIFK